ncbi:hypothetical protein JZ751_003955 [Albula glossodonta]|uniref:Telomeric repeat-binding factor n=1 Tax=Albula glossodonta TaxID=121402 RepID=A0A8T2PEL7_9TELE|nr:hypothetical protein JZ751_003955 [Albula glossodonta]
MESDTPEECGTTRNTDGRVAFSEVEKVARRWMIDFLFISVCRLFKEEKYLEFTQSLKSLEAMIEGSQKIGKDEKTKIELCGFLSRIVNGTKLAVQFEHNKQVTPLMSALSIWESISDVVIDKATYEKIKNLLFIQSIGVCLQQGSDTMASWVLKWLMEECQITENLKMKLSVIVNKKDAYHPFLTKWLFEEDKNLRRGVLRHGEGKWSKILQEFDFQNRTAVMLKDRWRTLKKKREKTKWLFEEDKNLRRGVLRHGEGKWSKILQEFDFQNRTAVMLKDRWRTLKKNQEKVARPHELPT